MKPCRLAGFTTTYTDGSRKQTENKDQENNGQAAPSSQAEKPKFQLWPTIKKQGPLPGRNPVEAVRPRLLASSHSSPSLRDSGLLISSKRLKQLKEASGTRRRKISFPDLGFGPMTTVQEHYVDSREYLADIESPRTCVNMKNKPLYQGDSRFTKDQTVLHHGEGLPLRKVCSILFLNPWCWRLSRAAHHCGNKSIKQTIKSLQKRAYLDQRVRTLRSRTHKKICLQLFLRSLHGWRGLHRLKLQHPNSARHRPKRRRLRMRIDLLRAEAERQ